MKKKLFLLLIFLLAAFFRFNNLNWDSNSHLHPDERFLTMVNGAQKIPNNILDYFNQSISTLNPANVGYKFFVYGTFPLTLNKVLAVIFGNDNYNLLTIQGRFLSAFFDLLTVFFVYKITKLLIQDSSKKQLTINNQQLVTSFLSTFFYATSVFPIQLSHFFAVDTFLTFFMMGSFYYILKFSTSRESSIKYKELSISAFFFGLALASKISAVYIFPLILIFIFTGSNKDLKKFLILNTYFLILVYFTARLADPYLFQNANFLNPTLSENFVKNIKELTVLSSGQVVYPPTIQWYSKKTWFLLINTVVFGVGLPYFLLIVSGIIWVVLSIKNQVLSIFRKSKNQLTINNYQLAIILLWVLGLFSYQSFQFVKSMRYTIYLYPFFAIFAGVGAEMVIGYWLMVNRKYKNKFILTTAYLLLTTTLLIWPLMFSSIYFHKHTRVEASEWIYKNLPNGSKILGEYWDDALPLYVEKNYGKQFKIEQIAVFDPDTQEKWQRLNQSFKSADYYILSSNRAWGSIPTMPERYPQMTKFYSELLANKTNYKLVKEFVSFPSLCFMFHVSCFMIDDQWSEELFTVYDHPKVMIFKREK